MKTAIKLLFLIVTLLNSPLQLEAKTKQKYRHHISMAAIFRDEARWLKEWIEYHRLIGVEHFYLYNNRSQDNYKEVLTPYINQGIVELVEWPYESTSVEHWTRIQCSAYNDAIKKSTKTSRWLAVLDIDEFIVPVQHNHLAPFLANYERYGGVIIHWQMFGTSNVEKIPDDKLMIETLTWKAGEMYGENALVKSIFHPKDVKEMRDPHKAEYKKKKYQVNTRKQRIPNSNNTIYDLEQIRINHYWSRDNEYFQTKKRKRREGWLEGFDGQLARVNNLHQLQDHLILRFVPELKKRMELD